MTMLSFRVAQSEAVEAQRWAEALGVERSALLRDALHRHLVRLRSEREPDMLTATPLSEAELAVGEIADWGPSEDWSDWSDAAR
jgi:hypothetical protein